MLEIKQTSSFRKDLKLLMKRKYNMNLISEVVNKLASCQKLDEKYKDHELTGNFKGYRECHIQPDWLLIYKIDNKQLILTLTRTGSNSNLFG